MPVSSVSIDSADSRPLRSTVAVPLQPSTPMLVAPEVASLLTAPVLGPPARALCGALQTPDIHGTTLRDTLALFVREAHAQGMPIGDLRRALTLMARDCSRAPARDRAGITEYVVRRAELLYEEADFTLGTPASVPVVPVPAIEDAPARTSTVGPSPLA